MFNQNRCRYAVVLTLALAMIGAAVAGCDQSNDHDSKTQSGDASATPAVDPIVQARPKDEADLMTFDQASAEVRGAPNDIIRQQVEDRWDKAFCAAVGNVTNFLNWTGRVETINENGYFEVDLGGYITLVDIGIVKGSDLYKVITGLHQDQPVKISGYFTHGGEACDIFVNRKFGVHLSVISPL